MRVKLMLIIMSTLAVALLSEARANATHAGVYVKIEETSTYIKWELVRQVTLPTSAPVDTSVFNVTATPPPPGDDGSDPGFIIYGNERQKPTKRRNTFTLYSDDDAPPLEPIVVTGPNIPRGASLMFNQEDPSIDVDHSLVGTGIDPNGLSSATFSANCPDATPIGNLEKTFQEIWDDSFATEPVSFENGGLAIPNGQGGYELFHYGTGTCNLTPPATAGEYPSNLPAGTIFIHSHPYFPAEKVPACGGPYKPGPSFNDRGHLGWLQQNIRSDIIGVVIDETNVYIFRKGDGDDLVALKRCGYSDD